MELPKLFSRLLLISAVATPDTCEFFCPIAWHMTFNTLKPKFVGSSIGNLWMDRSSMKTCFTAWRDHIRLYFMLTVRATKHHVANTKKKVVLTWLLHVRDCIGDNCVKYNRLGEADLSSQSKLVIYVLMNWRQHTKSLVGSKKMRRTILSRLARTTFLHWKTTTKSQRQTKDKVLLQWLGVESIYIRRPFRCWRNIVENNKCRIEKRLIDTHLRCKRRRWMPSSEIW